MNTKKRADIFILIMLCYSVIISIILEIVFTISFSEKIPILASLLGSQLIVVGLPSLIYFISQKDSKIPIGKLSIKEIILIILVAITLSPLLNLINVLSQFVVKNNVADMMLEMMSIPLIPMLLLTAFLPATLEELLTRGIIINNYEKESVLKTIFISGLFFGFIHMNINQFLYAFILGMVMCYLVLATESIFASMIIHFVINASSTIIFKASIFFQKLSFESMGMSMSDTEIIQKMMEEEMLAEKSALLYSSLILLGFSVICVPIAYFLIRVLVKGRNKELKGSLSICSGEFSRMIKRDDDENEFLYSIPKDNNSQKNRFFNLPLILATMIFLIFSILNEIAMHMS